MGLMKSALAPPASRARVTVPEAVLIRGAPRMRAKLNLFQRTMLRWRELYPYNVVHAVRVANPLDPRRLQESISRRMQAIGMTGLVLEPRVGTLASEGGAEVPELRVFAAGADPLATLWNEIEVQLNTPFRRAGRVRAFRFFAVAAGGDSCYLALVYDHFIAGGDAVALLLRSIVDDYARGEAAGRSQALSRFAPPAYWRLALHRPVTTARALLRLPRLIASTRRCARPPGPRNPDPYNGLTALRLGPEDAAAVRRAATAWDVTLNDLLLAALLQALAPLAQGRAGARRSELAVASIVNIRQDLPAAATDTFGPFLAPFHVTHPVPAGMSLQELAREVHAESLRIRREHLYLQTLAALGIAGVMWPWLSGEQRERFFPKYHPVWGGISMLNVDALWERAGSDERPPAEYFRAISTGPACPVVLAVTATGGALQVGISFRVGVFSRATVEQVKVALQRSLEGLRGERGE